MKKILATLSLALMAASAHADWARVDHPSKDLAVYIDRDSLKKSGVGLVQMWHLYDYASPQDYSGRPYMSVKGQYEYDCDKRVRRDLLNFFHTDGMGNNKMVQAEYKPGPWIKPETGSTDELLVGIACGTK